MIYVFNRAMTERRMLLTVESLTWKEMYYGIGTFSVVCRNTDENAAMLRKGNLVHFDGYDGLIQDVSIQDDSITANGNSLAVILNQRTAYNDTVITSAESGAYSLFSANKRGLDVDAATAQGLPGTCEVSVEKGGTLGDWMEQICSQAGLGFRVTLDEHSLKKTFEVYQGDDLTSPTDPHSVVFSTARNNLAGLQIEDDGSEYANVAVVKGKDLNEHEVMCIVGTATGAERYEIYVDMTGDPQKAAVTEFNDEGEEEIVEPAESDSAYQARLAAAGQEALQERVSKTSFTVTVQPTDYGVRYKLGDLVTCYSKKHGIELTARVSEVKYTKDTKKDTLEITLGEPTLTLRKLVRLWQK